jgi:hypothetical protein
MISRRSWTGGEKMKLHDANAMQDKTGKEDISLFLLDPSMGFHGNCGV